MKTRNIFNMMMTMMMMMMMMICAILLNIFARFVQHFSQLTAGYWQNGCCPVWLVGGWLAGW